MPHNEATVYMEKYSKHDSPASGNNSSSISSTTNIANLNTNREAKNSSPVFLVPAKKNDSPLFKYQGQKWDQVLDFDKMLKQIRNAERYYLRGRVDCVQSNGGKSGSSGNYVRRVQPQVQRLNAGDMHFYGMVPKKPFDVVVCDICLGIYTKMGFNNHMRLHHTQAWNSVSSKSAPAATSKDTAYHNTGNINDNNQEITREISASGNPLAESTANATPTATSSANNSRHKSSKSGSSGGSSRSRSKSKHHHHHHQTSSSGSVGTTSSAAASPSATQSTTSNTEVSSSHATSSSSKSSKKSSSSLNSNSESKLNHAIAVPKEEHTVVQPVTLLTSSSSNSSSSLPATPKMSNIEITSLPEATPVLSSKTVTKEKTKASKRKSKTASATAPAAYAIPENNESSNSSIEFSSIASNASANTTTSKSSKRSSKAKGGKDLKQLLEPQLSELDQAVSSITFSQVDSISDNTNSNDREDVITVATAANSSMGFSAAEANSLQIAARQTVQQAPTLFSGMQIIQEGSLNPRQQQPQLQQQNSNDNDSSMLTLDDMLDSKFIHEILNTDESEIHFDESELDKATAAQQQQQQPTYMQHQQTPTKRMRYDERLATSEHCAQQPVISGKFAAYQQQQQLQQPFQVTNLDDIKMYTTAIDAQQYLPTEPNQQQQQQQQHQTTQDQQQITTIDTLQLQQLLYQQQQHQPGLNAYAVDELNAAGSTLEQQQYNNTDVIMCSAEQLHKEGKINAADYATLTALSNNDAYGNVNAAAAAASDQFQVYNIPSLTDDDVGPDGENVANMIDSKLNNVIVPQNHYVLPGDGNEEEQLIYEITSNNQVSLMSQQRQQQMIAEFLTQAGYENMENVNMNITANSNAMLPTETVEMKSTITDADPIDDLLDFDFSRLETVSSISSSSSSSSENKTQFKTEPSSGKYMSTAALSDDMFLNVYLYAGLPRPLALNSFGLVKLPQSVATTFRKNLHATRKANNSPVYSLSGSGSPAVTARFGPNGSNAKSSAAQSYFAALGANAGSGAFNEFSNIGSITINNQSTSQQQQQLSAAQKQNELAFNATGSNVNGLLTAANAASPTTPSSGSRVSRPKSAGSNSSNAGTGPTQTKSKQYSSSGANANNNTFQLPQSQPKTIFVNTNLAASASNGDKFIKRSLISRVSLPIRSGTTFTAKQLSDFLLHPSKDSKEKYLQMLTTREQDRDNATEQQPQNRLDHVKSFYERRKKIMNATAHAASTGPGYNHARQLSTQLNGSSGSPAAIKQKLLRERLLRTLSDCGINSIKSNSGSPNNSGNSDILRVLA